MKRTYDFQTEILKYYVDFHHRSIWLERMWIKFYNLLLFSVTKFLKETGNKLPRSLKDGSIDTRRKCKHRNFSLNYVILEYHGESLYLYFNLLEEESDRDRSQFEFYNRKKFKKRKFLMFLKRKHLNTILIVIVV